MNNAATLPLIIEPTDLHNLLANLDDGHSIRVVDLTGLDHYAQGHIPGSIPLDYTQIVDHAPPVMGLLPNEVTLGQTLSRLGITKACHVIAYDNEGGGKAARLLWTLAACNHRGLSLLNGGLFAWEEGGLPKTHVVPEVIAGEYPVQYSNMSVVADRPYILSRLNDDDFCVVDARSTGEFEGTDVRAARGGHIPGAVHFEWTDAMDRSRELRLLDDETLKAMLTEKGITPDKEIVVYCHTHHRSAFSFWMLKHLGYTRVRGYPGSWSDWGNQPDTPID